MKKLFLLTSPKHKPDRMVELVKADINKYIARERRKAMPEGVDFWDFDCKCGSDATSAKTINIAELGKAIDQVFVAKAPEVYIEILAKPGVRTKKPQVT